MAIEVIEPEPEWDAGDGVREILAAHIRALHQYCSHHKIPASVVVQTQCEEDSGLVSGFAVNPELKARNFHVNQSIELAGLIFLRSQDEEDGEETEEDGGAELL